MTVRVYVSLTIGYPTADRSDVLEFDDGVTDDEIEQEVREWAFNYIEWSWTRDTDDDE